MIRTGFTTPIHWRAPSDNKISTKFQLRIPKNGYSGSGIVTYCNIYFEQVHFKYKY